MKLDDIEKAYWFAQRNIPPTRWQRLKTWMFNPGRHTGVMGWVLYVHMPWHKKLWHLVLKRVDPKAANTFLYARTGHRKED